MKPPDLLYHIVILQDRQSLSDVIGCLPKERHKKKA